MGSAADAEISSSYLNGQEAIPIWATLVVMGHPQPPTPVQVDNSTAEGFANMQFYWIQDRTRQGQFLIYWRPWADNLADYYHTKHHSVAQSKWVKSGLNDILAIDTEEQPADLPTKPLSVASFVKHHKRVMGW
jgi:hypothetical protein